MHGPSPRSRRPLLNGCNGSGIRGGSWAAWLPLLFIGSMMFWTVALGLGGWSLMAVSGGALVEPVGPAPTATEPMPGTGGVASAPGSDRIPVQMEESQEPEDVNDNAGSVTPMDWDNGPPGVAGTPR
jgi:hypothetical protein